MNQLSPELEAKLKALPTSHRLQQAITGMVRSFIRNDHRHIAIDTKMDTLRLMLNELRLQILIEIVAVSLKPDKAEECCAIMANAGLMCLDEQEKQRDHLKNLVSLYQPTSKEGKL